MAPVKFFHPPLQPVFLAVAVGIVFNIAPQQERKNEAGRALHPASTVRFPAAPVRDAADSGMNQCTLAFTTA